MPDGNNQNDLSGLAAVINSRLAAEARVAKGIAFAWVGGGLAIASLLAGVGFACALWGYSYLVSIRPAAEQIAAAMAEALERSEVKAVVSGTMTLDPQSQIQLAPGQTVRLAEGAVVKVDPASTVRVVGDLKIDAPRPSEQQLQLGRTSRSDDIPFTNYTIFRSVDFGAGEVVTGWNYELSDSSRPRFQFCYYRQKLEKGLSAKYTLAVNGSEQRPSSLSKLSFNFDGAVANCVWFSGA